jgi:hypothetical protein
MSRLTSAATTFHFWFFANCFASRIAAIMLEGLAIPFPAMS